MSSVEKLYRLQDGTQAAPGDCKAGKDGILRHKNGLEVLLDSAGEPLTIGAEAEGNVALQKAAFGDKAADEDKAPPQPLSTATMAPKPKADDAP